MTILDKINKQLAGGQIKRVWVDEILIRGKPSDTDKWGDVSGAHFTLGVERVDPLTGETRTEILPPMPASHVPDDATDNVKLAKLVGPHLTRTQRSLDDANATITKLQAQLDDTKSKLVASDASVTKLQGQLVGTEAKVDAALELIYRYQAVVKELQSISPIIETVKKGRKPQ